MAVPVMICVQVSVICLACSTVMPCCSANCLSCSSVSGWPIIITILGWILVIGGAVRILLPDTARSIQGTALDKPAMPTIGGGIQALIGALLCYLGYIA